MFIASSTGSLTSILPPLHHSNALFTGKKKKKKRKQPEVQPTLTEHSETYRMPEKAQLSTNNAPMTRGLSLWGKLKAGFLLYCLLFAEGQRVMAQQDPQDDRYFYNTHNALPSKKSRWGQNVEVLASASQRHFSHVRSDMSTGCYTQAVTEVLGRTDIKSIGEAHCQLQKNGYVTDCWSATNAGVYL